MDPTFRAALDLLLSFVVVLFFVGLRGIVRDARLAWREDRRACALVALQALLAVCVCSAVAPYAPYVVLLGGCIPLGVWIASGRAYAAARRPLTGSGRTNSRGFFM